jgi:hypothetical protein
MGKGFCGDLWRRESGQDGKGHECDGGPVSGTFLGSESLFPMGVPSNTIGVRRNTHWEK